MAYTRRAPAVHAGRLCQYKRPKTGICPYYARYEVSYDANGQINTAAIACGAHLSEAIRDTWKEHKSAAVVREIPGMWRSL